MKSLITALWIVAAVLLATDPAIAADVSKRLGLESWFYAEYGREPTTKEISAALAWYDCTDRAVDIFAQQPEPAKTVADAAVASCSAEMDKYAVMFGLLPNAFEKAAKPNLVARTIAIRAIKPSNMQH